MNIFTIGSEGFIGGFLVKALLDKGHAVTGMDLRKERGEGPEYKYIQGDLMDREDLSSAMEGVELVVNLAAKHHDFGVSREEFFEINERGTRNLLQVMSQKGVTKLVFFSTVAVYGEVEECSSEETRLNPVNDYGESKLAAERLIEQWAAEDRAREALIIRPAVVFGPDNFANMYKLIDTIYKRRYVPVGRGDNIKSVAYVENLVDMTLFVLERMQAGVEVYNYSDYDHLASREIVDIVHHFLGRRPPRFRMPLRPVLAVTGLIDIAAKVTGINFPITANRIKKLNMTTCHGSDKVRSLGFRQRYSIEEGLRAMVEWYLKVIL